MVKNIVFYNIDKFNKIHKERGFKICKCSNCEQLFQPFMIKNHREFEEYEELHAQYLAKFKANRERDGSEITLIEGKAFNLDIQMV